MMIKDRRTKILLVIFLISDVNFTFVNFDEKIEKIFDLPLNQKTRGTLSTLVKVGLIEKFQIPNPNGAQTPTEPLHDFNNQTLNTNKQSQKQYRLTEKGFENLCLNFPFFRFLKDSWDGKWRIISYEIPEAKREIRDRLRREMQGWGLGPWHRSFWLTPHPVIENLRQLVVGKEEEKYIQAFESNHVFGDREILIEKVWEKSVLDKKYRQLFKDWHQILSSGDEKLIKFRKIIEAYIELLKIDPGLPKELIGQAWIGFEGWSIYKEIRSILLS